MKDGILVIDKEPGITSRDVVNKAIKILGTKKIGHTGTLDPLASGVLVLAVNDGTKIIELLTSNDKEYIADIILGYETDTLDVDGKIEKVSENLDITDEQIMNVLLSFKKSYIQTVPKYSAVKINGKKLYEYARNNIEVDLPKRMVDIKDIELIGDIKRNDKYIEFSIRTTVSKGTYIRSLIRDIALELGTYGTMKNLRRTHQGIFSIDNAKKIDEITKTSLIPISEALKNYEMIYVDDYLLKKVKNGCKLDIKINDFTLIKDKNDKLLAIYEPYNDIARPYRVFGGNNEEN